MLLVGVAKCPLHAVVCYCAGSIGTKLVSVIQNSGVSTVEGFHGDVLKSMEIWSGHSEMSVITQVSAIEGCPLSGVPL